MALFKRGSVWHYDFQFHGVRHQGSTFLKNHEKAKMYVAKLRSDLALGLVGLTHREPPPILSAFLQGQFLSSVKQNAKKPRTLKFYVERVKQLCLYIPFTQLRLNQIDELAIQGYKDFRLSKVLTTASSTSQILVKPSVIVEGVPASTQLVEKRLSPATINGELRTLRKALIFAEDCGLIRYRRVRTLPGETGRTFILTGEMEHIYLAAASYPLREVAILMLDLGLRPEEACALRKVAINHDSVTIVQGKTSNARRTLPQTQRTRQVFHLCRELFPESEWVFPGSKGKHYTRGAISNLHTALRDKLIAEADIAEASGRVGIAGTPAFTKEFVIYSCRHTYGTRLAESGASAFEICYLMGHASVKTSEKYIHFSPSSVTLAAKRLEAYNAMLRGEVHESGPPQDSGQSSTAKSKTS